MSYIGRQPTVGNFQICDAISVVNNQAAYTMQVGSVNVSPESSQHMIVSLNGVIQKSGGTNPSFTVSGSTITFASNLVTGDVINFIQILGSVLDLGVPSDATVSTAKIVDGAVTSAKLASGVGGVDGIVSNANATAMTINSSEQVGIGTTSPSEKLHIETSSGDADVLLHAAENNSGSDARLFLKTTNTSATPSLFFGDSANDGMGYVKYLNNGNSMQFGTNAAHQWSLDSSGNFLPAATDHGIYLGTTSATAANLLDDYEEGTYTPAISFSGGTTGIQYNSGATAGVYTKVGRMVTVSVNVTLTNKGSSTGTAEITLPFTPLSFHMPHNHGQWGMASRLANVSAMVGMVFRVRADATTAYFQPMISGTDPLNNFGNNSNFTNTTNFAATFVYATN